MSRDYDTDHLRYDPQCEEDPWYWDSVAYDAYCQWEEEWHREQNTDTEHAQTVGDIGESKSTKTTSVIRKLLYPLILIR